MSRRATQGSARSRRTPVPTQAGGGPSIPRAPIIALLGIAAVVGLFAYLVWQTTKPAGNRFEGAAAAEADPNPELPGEFVNLQTIYGGAYGSVEGTTTAPHVTRDVDYLEDQGELPPAGGPHWGTAGACPTDPEDAPLYCGPVPWGIHRQPWRMESVVHNMEHGGAILWYNTTDQGIIDELEDLIKGRLNRGDLLVMVPLPEMEEETIAVSSWSRRDKFSVDEYNRNRVEEFFDKNERRFNPEDF